MRLARKIILHCPVSDERLLDEFVEDCLGNDVSLIAVAGPGCQRIEDMIDWIVVDDGSGADRFVCTTSHPDEPLSDVIELVECWELEQGDPYQEVRL
jgi:hypothetical protein